VVVNFQALAAKQMPEWGEKPDFLQGDWRTRFEAETGSLVEGWAVPSALVGVSPGMGLPQELVGNMAVLDLTIHPWDLARATGQPFSPDPSAVAALQVFVEHMGPQARKMGVFGEPVAPPEDASELDRLLAATGRSATWQVTA
jgi:uncharacterized protein (TIGR03086 family)